MGAYIVTIKQFGGTFLPKLVDSLVREHHFKRTDARKVGKNVMEKLERKFFNDKTQPVQVFQEAIVNIVTVETNKYRRLMDKNFDLSEDSFHEMIARMKKGDNSIFEVIFLSHFDSCLSYVQTKYNASHRNAYDASMNAMLAFCKGLIDGAIVYGNLRFLFTQMAGQYYLKWLRKDKVKRSIEGIDLAEEEEDSFDEKSLNKLDKAWELLGKECQNLLQAFYFKNKQLKDIAGKYEKSPSAIRKQKQRCIEKLRGYFKKMKN